MLSGMCSKIAASIAMLIERTSAGSPHGVYHFLRRKARRAGTCDQCVLLPTMAIVPAPQAVAVDDHPGPPRLARERRHASCCKFFHRLERVAS
jgi:hypothetical protein